MRFTPKIPILFSKFPLLLLLLLLIILALMATVSFWSFGKIGEAADARQHIYAEISSANTLLSKLKDSETGQRGYLITRNESYLEPYLAVKDSVPLHLKKLRESTLISAAQKHLDIAAPLINLKMEELSKTVELGRQKDLTKALEYVASGRGKNLMDEIRVEFNSFNQIEEDALVQHEAKFQANMHFLFIVIFIASLTGLPLTFVLVYFIYREAQQRLDNVVHAQTLNFLETQRALNNQLQHANTTLRKSREQLLSFIQNAPISIAIFDRDMNYLDASTNWVMEFGRGHTDLTGHNYYELNLDMPAEWRGFHQQGQAGTIFVNHEEMWIQADGKKFWLRWSLQPWFDHNQEIAGIIIAAENISERKHAEQLLLDVNAELVSAKGVAVSANNAKSDFLASMSHELRTPLNAILGFAQLMETASPPPSPSQAQSINQILKAGWHLLELINEILDLVQIESSKITLSNEPVSLEGVMVECQSMLEPQARERKIRLTFSQLQTPCFVYVDRTRLKQCLINLLSNAIKYNRPGGDVAVECIVTEPDAIRITIRDTGVGLSQEQLAQLFQPFNRLGQEAGVAEGSGIGLVVTKRLVELMGGKIGVQSTVGMGSAFWIEFGLTMAPQLAEKEVEHAAQVRPSIQDGMPLRTVLCVEDNPANLVLVEQLIARRPDLHLLCASTGNLGITFARTNQPKVIFMDIDLPGISGIETMKILRADLSTAHIPVIVISANAMPRDVEEAMKAGFFHYLTKPIVVSEFMDTLDAALKFAETNPTFETALGTA